VADSRRHLMMNNAIEEFKQQRQKVREFRQRLERRCGINDYRDVEDFKRKERWEREETFR
jgi:hypothetical protein